MNDFLIQKLQALKSWFVVKEKLIVKHNQQKNIIPCKMGDVYFADLGTNIGSEIDKKRPVMVWQIDNRFLKKSDTVFVLPMTSNISEKLFKVRYMKDVVLGLENGALLVDQGRTISKTRLGKYFGRMPNEILEKVAHKFIELHDLHKFNSLPPRTGENSQTSRSKPRPRQ